MTTRCITWMDTRSRIYVYIGTQACTRAHTPSRLSSSGVAGGTPPRTSESSNDEALDYCINNATNSAVSCQSLPSRALFGARFSGLELESISYRCSIRPDFGHECVYTAFGVAADTRFPPGR